jgi:hypothetical protein
MITAAFQPCDIADLFLDDVPKPVGGKVALPFPMEVGIGAVDEISENVFTLPVNGMSEGGTVAD